MIVLEANWEPTAIFWLWVFLIKELRILTEVTKQSNDKAKHDDTLRVFLRFVLTIR